MVSPRSRRPSAAPRWSPRPSLRGRRLVAVVAALVALVGAACTSGGDDDGGAPPEPAPGVVESDGGEVRLTALSTRPQYVTNGDVLVAVDSPSGAPLTDLRVQLDGRDVTTAFEPDTSDAARGTDRLVGLVSGMLDGPATITATAGGAEAALEVVNHPVDGPLFSGPHQRPFVCTTERNGLGPAGDLCWAQSRVRWQYRTTEGELVDLPDPEVTPADVATTTVDGRRVPFVVRLETGVFNRSVTTFATLDPEPGPRAGTVPGSTPARAWDPSGWNGRLVVRFGGGCGATFSQGNGDDEAVDLALLGAGYAVVASTLTTFQTACNDVVAAETVMVAKEHFSEAYGEPVHTIGTGGSGGAIQQLLIAQGYPGLLDAIAPAIPFPDAVTIAGGVADCGLLGRFYGEPTDRAGIVTSLIGTVTGGLPQIPADPFAPGARWSNDQRQAVNGFASPLTCAVWKATYFENLDPSKGCDEALVDAGQVWSADDPRGARCTFQDSNVNLLGTDPDTGYALRPLDNVGVQYGLEALNDGAISVGEFLELNEEIGGYDIDGRWQPERMRASDEVLERVYADGRITAGSATASAGAATAEGAGGLVDVPVLLVNVVNDGFGDIHDRQRTLAIRERLRLPDGSPNPNVVTWTLPGAEDLQALLGNVFDDRAYALDAVRVLDEWLTAAEAEAGEPRFGADVPAADAASLTAARPPAAVDRCTLPDGTVVTGAEATDPDGPCAEAYPASSDPRRVAGAPLVNVVVACALTPVDAASDLYEVDFTPEQAERLERAFPDGVCDWSRPGRGQRPLRGTWLTYG